MEKLLCILRSANYYNVNYIYENIHFFALKKKQKHPLYNAFYVPKYIKPCVIHTMHTILQ